MPAAVFNRVRQTVASAPGTGAIALGPAVSGLYRTFAQSGATNGLLVNYVIEDGANWEYGRGTWSSTGPTLTRTTILASSNGGAAINATSAAIVFCDVFAEDATNQVQLIGTTGDLSASPQSTVLFTGLSAYTDLVFDISNVTHDFGSAQTFGLAASLDGTTFTSPSVITGSFAAAVYVSGQATITFNGTEKPILQAITASGSASPTNPPNVTNANSNVVRVLSATAGVTIQAVRIAPTSGGNFNRGTIRAWGR